MLCPAILTSNGSVVIQGKKSQKNVKNVVEPAFDVLIGLRGF